MKFCLTASLLFNVFISFSQNQISSISLSDNVNTIYNELHPLISPDGRTLYLIREGHPENTFIEKTSNCQDIWYSELQPDGQWTKAVHMIPPFNKSNYNAIFSISPDGNTILLRGAYQKGKLFNQGFSVSHKTATGWSTFEMIDVKDFSTMSKGIYYGGYLSNDGRVLLMYFSETVDSEMSDLYVSLLKKTGEWTKPRKLKVPVNTKSDELAPFLASDGKTLYFASDRPGGIGKNDIYVTRRLDKTWTNWSPPENLGKNINTENSESFYSLDATGEYAYVITTMNKSNGTDIVKIKLNEEIKPDPVVLIAGKVLNTKNNEPVAASIQYEVLGENTEAGIAQSNPANGEYKIILPYGKNYGFSANASGFIAISDNIDLTTVAAYKEIKMDLLLTPIEVGQTIRLNNIFFDFGQATLRPESFPEINRLVELMKENLKIEIEISGHTDNIGSDEANTKLSADRANAVRDYIVLKGITNTRISAKGYGSNKPVASNDTDEGRQQNRRVEFTILKK